MRVVHMLLHGGHFQLVFHHFNLIRHHSRRIQFFGFFQQPLPFLFPALGNGGSSKVKGSHRAVVFHIQAVVQCFAHKGFNLGWIFLCKCQPLQIMEVAYLPLSKITIVPLKYFLISQVQHLEFLRALLLLFRSSLSSLKL